MMLMLSNPLSFVAVSALLEVLLARTAPSYKRLRGLLAVTAAGMITALSIYIVLSPLHITTLLLSLAGAYRLVNVLRIYRARMHQVYLRRVTLQTTVLLAGAQAELYLLHLLGRAVPLGGAVLWLSIAGLQFIGAVLMLLSIRRHQRHAAHPELTAASALQPEPQPLPDSTFPTITVAVAARNETDSLLQCLEAVVASDYPKLEVLVLDDCSQTRRTPEIIRGFAHDGVRFIPGSEPRPSWLARNNAYNTLAQSASGSYIVFLSTAVRLQPQSLRTMVQYALARDKYMLSVMPQYDGSARNRSLLESIRASWELLLPRRWIGRPPVADSCWLIDSRALQRAGGFAAVSRMITPEAYFARHTAAGDHYSFMPGGEYFGIRSAATSEEQQEHAVRTAYPALHRRPETVATVTLATLLVGILPFATVFLLAQGAAYRIAGLLSAAAVLCLLAAYRGVLLLTYGTAPYRMLFAFPLTTGLAIALHHYSMLRYEFGEVRWKERNICIPVMHVTPHRPTDMQGQQSRPGHAPRHKHRRSPATGSAQRS